MKIFGELGGGGQVIDSRASPKCPAGYIEMKAERPTVEMEDGVPVVYYIATENGEWIEKPKPKESGGT